VSDTFEPLVVPAGLAGVRLDLAVSMLTGWSRNEVQVLIDAGAILVAGAPALKSRKLVEGEIVELLAAPAVEALPGPEPVPVEVRHADDDLIIVAKPAGLVVHPGAGHAHGTLVQGLLARFPEIAGVGDPVRPGIVHRLDRDTSGLLAVARSPRAYDELVEAIAAREVERRYLALVWGEPESPRGVIDAPIGRSARRRTRMAVRESGREARTAYEVLATWPDAGVSLVECRLETGRTHQIRVHLAAIGHPVVGDAAYGGARAGTGGGLRLVRPFLHAHALGLRHPGTGEPLTFEEPLPGELTAVLGDLGPGDGPSGGVGGAGRITTDTAGGGPGVGWTSWGGSGTEPRPQNPRET
jgi:23S rRNA pseudouridine1911/1915/1917 synthase